MKLVNINVLGNGFDIAHGHKSTYKNFKEYLVNKKCESNSALGIIQDFIKNDELELWSSLEENIPEIIFKLMDEWGLLSTEELQKKGIEYNFDPRKVFQFVMRKIWSEFNAWITRMDSITEKRINSGHIKNKINKYFCENFFNSDVVLNIVFNYIETTKDVYRNNFSEYMNKNWVDYHIHNKAHGNMNGESLIFGNTDDYDEEKIHKLIEGRYKSITVKSPMSGIVDFDDEAWKRSLREIFERGKFQKDSKSINVKLLNKLNEMNIDNDCEIKINVFGHSLGRLDEIYFLTINDFVNKYPKFQWVFYYYSETDKSNIESFIQKNEVKKCSHNTIISSQINIVKLR